MLTTRVLSSIVGVQSAAPVLAARVFQVGRAASAQPKSTPWLNKRLFGAEAATTAAGSTTMKIYHAEGHGAGSHATVTCRGHKVMSDMPRDLGGKDSAVQPVELLLSALVGCEIATATFVARQMKPRLNLKDIRFNYEAERDIRGAMALPIDATPPVTAHLTRISGTAEVRVASGEELSAERLALLKEQVESRCPVSSMVRASGCEMDVTWVRAPENQEE